MDKEVLLVCGRTAVGSTTVLKVIVDALTNVGIPCEVTHNDDGDYGVDFDRKLEYLVNNPEFVVKVKEVPLNRTIETDCSIKIDFNRDFIKNFKDFKEQIKNKLQNQY